jgi:hypothetical protein
MANFKELSEKRTCEKCGEPYFAKRRNQKYCSSSCRAMTYYEIKKDKISTMQKRLDELEQLKQQN